MACACNPKAAPRLNCPAPPGVNLRSSTVQTLALALHELLTNAGKYGALGRPEGRLRIEWRLDGAEDEPRLVVMWTEYGIAVPDEAPKGSGYGRELLEQALPYTLGAETSYDLTREGLRCTIALPVTAGAESGAPE